MSDEIDTAAPPKKMKAEADPPPPCPRCAAMTEFDPEKKINALVETCRDLIMRIEATEGPAEIFMCLEAGHGFRFRAFKKPKVDNSFVITSRFSEGIFSIEYTKFKGGLVDSIGNAKCIIDSLLDTKEHARSQVSPERYKLILYDVVDRLVRIQDLLSDTHNAATVDTERLNYKLKKLLKPYERNVRDELVINTPHSIFVESKHTCDHKWGNGKCNSRAIIHCTLCKKYCCELHIKHNPTCWLNECVEGCGCSDSEEEE